MNYFDFHHHNAGRNGGIYNFNGIGEVPQQKFSVGLHPKFINKNWRTEFAFLRKASMDQNCLAIGECGLDRLVAVPEDIQAEVFTAHINWANEIGKPLIIHCVRRFEKTIQLCKASHTAKVIHGFHKKSAVAETLLSHDFYLSFGETLISDINLQETFKAVPLNRLFLESDTSAIDIKDIYRLAAELKGITVEQLNTKISENLKRICCER